MIVVVDNGRGAEDIARVIRGPKEIMKPAEAAKAKASGYILTDGDMKHQKTNVQLIEKTNRPILAIGAAYAFLGAAFGVKAKESKMEKMDRVKIEHPCPLTLDLKKVFTVMQNGGHVFEDLPENFSVVASSPKNEFKIVEAGEKPFFGVQFNPEMGGDGLTIINNFVKFVDVWEKYHKV